MMGRFAALAVTATAAVSLLVQPAPVRGQTLDPEHKVGSVNGKAITVGSLEKLLSSAPDAVRRRLSEDPKEFFIFYTLMDQLSREARENGLDQNPRYKRRLEWQQAAVLMGSQINAMAKAIEVPEQDVKSRFEADPARYRKIRVTTAHIPFPSAKNPTEAIAKARAEELVRRVRAGESFQTLAMEFSDQPALADPANAQDILPDSNLPVAARQALSATATGQVTDPAMVAEAYAVYRVEGVDELTFEQAREAIREELRQKAVSEYFANFQKGLNVQVLSPDFFKAYATGASSGTQVDPKAVVAQAGGTKYTAEEMAAILQGAPPGARQNASANPERFLIEFSTLFQLADDARKAGLDRKPPASEQLYWRDGEVLLQARLDQVTLSFSTRVEDQQKYYEEHLEDMFRVVTSRLIYISFSTNATPGLSSRTEEEARALASEVHKKLSEGADFGALVEQYSEDPQSKAQQGRFMELRSADTRIPPEIRDAVFAAESGALLQPLRLTNGFYIFLVGQNRVIPFDQVRDQIYQTINNKKFEAWFEDTRAKIKVEIDDSDAIKTVLAAAQ